MRLFIALAFTVTFATAVESKDYKQATHENLIFVFVII